MLKRIGVIATAGTAAGAGVILTQRPGLAIDTSSLSADDLSLSSNNGKLNELTLQPDLDYSWDGLDQPPSEITFTVAVRIDSNNSYQTVEDETKTLTTTDLQGTGEYQFTQAYDIIANTGLTAGDFEPAQGGGNTSKSNTETVGVQVTGDLKSPNTTYTDSVSTTYDVTITNEPGQTGVGGNAGTGGSMKGKDPGN